MSPSFIGDGVEFPIGKSKKEASMAKKDKRAKGVIPGGDTPARGRVPKKSPGLKDKRAKAVVPGRDTPARGRIPKKRAR